VSNFEDVGAFHKKFDLPNGAPGPRDVSMSVAYFRRKFLEEELEEFKDAQDRHDIVGIADALVDLVYVALGTAHFYGLPWEELWDEVQRANMKKVRALSADASKRGSVFDVVKPPGWQPPDLARILRQYGEWQL
jgi:predicted HAD superfamily Cof-like phosphohydrolase